MPYGLPITISEGDFSDPDSGQGSTPLAKIAVRFSEAVINSAWSMAEAKSTSATAKSDALSSAIDDIMATPGDYHVTAGSVTVPTVTAPGVSIPSSVDTSSILATFDAESATLATFLSDKFTHIITTYFPNVSTTYAASEAWISAAIDNESGGIPLTVQSQMLADDHARISADASRATDAMMQTFAARRFPLPPGAAASAALQIQQKSQELMAESSRKLTALSVENMKWAVEKAVSLRELAMNEALNYAKTLATAPELAAGVTGLGYGEQSKLISAASQFYGADTNAKEMIAKVEQFNQTISLDAAAKNQAANISLLDDKLKALLADFQMTMQQAGALLNNLHANAGTTLSI